MIYWDTSCVLKLYTEEGDSADWQERACQAEVQLVSSRLTRTECAYALQRKECRGELVRGGAAALLGIFDRDIAAGRFDLFAIGEDVLDEAVAIAGICRRATPCVPLRTLAGLHLATARLLNCARIATADIRMRRGAERIGLALA